MYTTIAEVLSRVGTHPIKAAVALKTEQSSAKPRKTLIAKLEALASSIQPDADMPAGLGEEGTRFWVEARGLYSFRLDELALLERACRILDDLADLDFERAGLESRTTYGSQGQLVTHPIIDQIHRGNADLRQTLKALNLPDPDAAKARSSQARKAALTRWGG